MAKQTKIFTSVVVLAGLGVAYWLLSPLFIDKIVNESLWGGEASNIEEQITDPQTMSDFKEEMKTMDQNEQTSDDMPAGPEITTLATGSIVEVVHKGTGDVKIIEVDGKKILRFENLDVLNGPDLRVFISKSTYVKSSGDLGEHIELGKLKGNKGNQNYEIPDDLDVTRYNTVIIYCNPFSVVFNTARLDRSK
ncbi:MAG TPA: DM13 domain-containing protein [Candidatus Magasanikbacteria bacterium]|nr:DM13 domain-containing protein [Candidatus Magasanikbacteria bacterium]